MWNSCVIPIVSSFTFVTTDNEFCRILTQSNKKFRNFPRLARPLGKRTGKTLGSVIFPKSRKVWIKLKVINYIFRKTLSYCFCCYRLIKAQFDLQNGGPKCPLFYLANFVTIIRLNANDNNSLISNKFFFIISLDIASRPEPEYWSILII